eukprot:3393020-Rhodomonas_salina.1
MSFAAIPGYWDSKQAFIEIQKWVPGTIYPGTRVPGTRVPGKTLREIARRPLAPCRQFTTRGTRVFTTVVVFLLGNAFPNLPDLPVALEGAK